MNKDHSDINDTAREQGDEGVREQVAKAKRFSNGSEQQQHKPKPPPEPHVAPWWRDPQLFRGANFCSVGTIFGAGSA